MNAITIYHILELIENDGKKQNYYVGIRATNRVTKMPRKISGEIEELKRILVYENLTSSCDYELIRVTLI